MYFHIINTQKNTVNNVVTKNHHSVKYENGEKYVRLFNCQSNRNNNVHIVILNNTNSAIKYRENHENIINNMVSDKNIINNINNTLRNFIL